MVIPPICIIQARLKSTRLENKMLLKLGGETLIARAVRLARMAFGALHVIVAIPKSDEDGPLGAELRCIGANVFAWDGDEANVLGRFHAAATRYRWHPQSVIVRWTPDDPFKDSEACRQTAEGMRFPVEIGCEAFTLAALDRAFHTTHADDLVPREHLGNHRGIFPFDPIPCPPGIWTVDTQEDYEAAQRRFAVHGDAYTTDIPPATGTEPHKGFDSAEIGDPMGTAPVARPIVPGVAHPDIDRGAY